MPSSSPSSGSSPSAGSSGNRLTQSLADGWRVVRVNLIPGVLGWIVQLFRGLAAWVERSLYAVDEWFRFREGQSKPSIRLKMALGCVWFPIAYVVRFAFNLLIEPQVNPVKHFPVVTVSHKVLFTTLIPVSNATGIPEATLGVMFTGIPGIFGFLAWELRENWRLYAANRPRTLQPVQLGHHGETMRGLLRPGFHSGTVPKQFKTIRRQLAHPPGDRKEAAIAKAEHELHHLERAVERFVDREFLPLLQTTKVWNGTTIRTKVVHVTNTNVSIAVEFPKNLVPPQAVITPNWPYFQIMYYQHDGVIYAQIDDAFIETIQFHHGTVMEELDVLIFAFLGMMTMGAATSRQVGICGHPPMTWTEWVEYWERASKTSTSLSVDDRNPRG